jgi:hypothetical protein
MLLVAGAVRTGSAAGAGAFIAAGSGGEFIPDLGSTGTHQLFHFGLATMGTFHIGVGPEDQLLKILVTTVAMKFKYGHVKKNLLKNHLRGGGLRSRA